MFQLYRIDPVTLKKYAVGNPNESRDFLCDCVRKEYAAISLGIDEDGAVNVTGHAISTKGVKTSECWRIEPILKQRA